MTPVSVNIDGHASWGLASDIEPDHLRLRVAQDLEPASALIVCFYSFLDRGLCVMRASCVVVAAFEVDGMRCEYVVDVIEWK